MNSPYQPRTFHGLPDWTISGHRLKPYGIVVGDGDRVEPVLVDRALAFTRSVLSAAADAEGDSEGLGYCVLHTGTLGTWLLIHWWAHRDICCQRLALAAPGASRFQSMDERPLLACVWEQVVMHHEREAWVRHMMAATPDAQAYLRDRLPDGRY